MNKNYEDDPVYKKLSWQPCNTKTSANFKTHKLVISGKKIIIKKSIFLIIFSTIFIFIGLFQFKELDGLGINKQSIAGFIFSGGGGFMLFYKSDFVIDKLKGIYYFKRYYFLRNALSLEKNKNSYKKFGKISDIYAIQIISEFIEGDSDSKGYSSYEINIVLRTGERLNIMDHGWGISIKRNAKQIAKFLDIPIWGSPDYL